MIPSQTWFPTSLQDRAAWFQNFMDKFLPALATSLGFSAAERSAIEDDNTDFQAIAATQLAADNFMAALRQFRISLTEDPVGTPAPVFPPSGFAAPPIGVPAGIFQRLVENVERIRAAPAYTDETGASLGILPSKPGPTPEGDLKPSIKTEVAEMGYKFTAKVGRSGQPAFKLQIQREGSSAWTDAGVSTSSSIEYTVVPTTPGQPRSRI